MWPVQIWTVDSSLLTCGVVLRTKPCWLHMKKHFKLWAVPMQMQLGKLIRYPRAYFKEHTHSAVYFFAAKDTTESNATISIGKYSYANSCWQWANGSTCWNWSLLNNSSNQVTALSSYLHARDAMRLSKHHWGVSIILLVMTLNWWSVFCSIEEKAGCFHLHRNLNTPDI